MDNPYYERLVNASLRFVSYRPRSEKEFTDFLTNKLKRWKVAGGVLIKKVIERMRELGYVDDKVFAAWWVDQRMAFKQKGRRYIALELARKGISREVIEEVFSTTKDGLAAFNELEVAKIAIERKIVTWARLPIIEQKKKMYTFLAQRGFSSDTICKIIDEIVKKE
jgi:regulatory protein